MEKSIKLQNQKIAYILKVSSRARRMRLTVYGDGTFVVTVPRRLSANIIEQFIREKSAWIIKKLKYFKNNPQLILTPNDRASYLKYKVAARSLVQKRINYFNRFYNFKFNRISIRNQKTRWGSCSRKGNLNFNYKIVLLPIKLADYLIVHELCHLKELNHSPQFWNLVAKVLPNYLALRKALRQGSNNNMI